MNKVNPFPALTAPFTLIHLSNLFVAFNAAFKAILLTNPLFLALSPKLSNQEPKDTPDWIILDSERY